jgi:hypothetical protein
MSAGTPGANMEDERPAMKVMVKMRRMIDQRRRGDQLMGLVGSFGKSQLRCLGPSNLRSVVMEDLAQNLGLI